jgi:hypothetical protein
MARPDKMVKPVLTVLRVLMVQMDTQVVTVVKDTAAQCISMPVAHP